MEHHRKQAKALVRGYRAGDAEARERADAILGSRARERFLLSDAQHVVAREQGHRSWADLKRANVETPVDRLGRIRADLSAAEAGWGELGEGMFDTGTAYVEGDPVRVLVRKRGSRYDINDEAAAVERAGRPAGWLEAAERAVAEYWLNVNRRGVVFVGAVEGGVADRPWLVLRIGDASLAVYQALLELDA